MLSPTLAKIKLDSLEQQKESQFEFKWNSKQLATRSFIKFSAHIFNCFDFIVYYLRIWSTRKLCRNQNRRVGLIGFSSFTTSKTASPESRMIWLLHCIAKTSYARWRALTLQLITSLFIFWWVYTLSRTLTYSFTLTLGNSLSHIFSLTHPYLLLYPRAPSPIRNKLKTQNMHQLSNKKCLLHI